MADIRINALPNEPSPSGTDVLPIDGVTTRKTTITAAVLAGRPTASQAEAEAGTDPTKAMTPLATAQAISFQVTNKIGVSIQAQNATLQSLSGLALTNGAMLVSGGPGSLSSLPVGSVNQVLQVDGLGNVAWQSVAGTGDVIGPASAVVGTVPTYNNVNGKVIAAGNPLLLDILKASAGPMPTIANNSTDATNDIDFSAGAVFSSDATKWPIVAAALTKQLDVAWAAGNNAGGRMSAAAIANTSYHCFIIRNPTTGVVDAGMDVSATAPTLPTGFTQFVRIGSIMREAGAIAGFKQDGDYFSLNTTSSDWGGTNPGTAAFTRALRVPSGIRVRGKTTCSLNSNTASTIYILVSDLAQPDQTPGSNAYTTFVIVTSGFTSTSVVAELYTNTSSSIRIRVSSSTAGLSVAGVTLGWYDETRGT